MPSPSPTDTATTGDAKDRGAKVFLSPAENCPEAKSTKPSGITLVKVETLKGALAALKTLREGGTPPAC